MYRIRFRPGSAQDPDGELTAPPELLAGLRGATSNGREGKRRKWVKERKERGGKRKGREEMGGKYKKHSPLSIPAYAPWVKVTGRPNVVKKAVSHRVLLLFVCHCRHH